MCNSRALPTGTFTTGSTVIVAVTATSTLAEVYPGADAVIVAAPTLCPTTCGWTAGDIAPAATKTLLVGTITWLVLLLVSVTTTPPAGAGVPRTIGNGADSPSGTDRFGSVIDVPATTLIPTVASAIAGSALTRIVVEPAATPVTGTTATPLFA